MTRERYFEMQEQMGHDIVEADIPPDWEDFPDIIVNGLDIYNRLGDRVYPEIGYIGKDFTNLNLYLDLYGIEESDKDYLLQIIEWLDARAIKQSADKLKREYDKIKRKK